ncbi:MAG: serine hydrolase [Bacteroidota bacterium]
MKSINFLLLFSLALDKCQAQKNWNKSPDLNDGWSITNPASVGMDEGALRNLLSLMGNRLSQDFRAITVSKDGKLVVEEYFNSFWRNNINDIRSAGKSITSMLAGIAMDKGLFKPTDKVVSFFPEYKAIKNPSAEKSAITVADLLVMSSGLASDDYANDSPGLEDYMTDSEDYLKFVLDLPMDFKTGEKWAYSSAVAFLLGSIIENTAEQTLEDFAQENLFGPMGIKHFFWEESPKGRNTGMGNIYLRARDMAKLGQLMLDNGRWNGQQILSSDFVKKSIEKKFDISDNDPWAHGYGYMWYLAKIDIKGQTIDYYYASGNGGNKIFVIPELNMVVTTLSSAYGTRYGQRRSHGYLEAVLRATIKKE